MKPQKRCRRRARSFDARESFAGVAFWRALILPRRVLTQPIGGSIFEKALFCRGEASPWAPYLPTPGRYWVHPVRNLHQGEAFFGRPPGLGSRRSKVLILPRRVGGRNLQKMLNFPKQGPRAYEKCCSGSARQAPGPQKCSKKQGKCTRIALRRNCSRFAAENAPYKNVGQFWLKMRFFFQIGKLNMKITVLHRGTP